MKHRLECSKECQYLYVPHAMGHQAVSFMLLHVLPQPISLVLRPFCLGKADPYHDTTPAQQLKNWLRFSELPVKIVDQNQVASALQ